MCSRAVPDHPSVGDLGSHLSRRPARAGVEPGRTRRALCAVADPDLLLRAGSTPAHARPTRPDRRRPSTISIERLIAGANRPGNELRRHRHWNCVPWASSISGSKDAVVPGAFRRAEELIALAVWRTGTGPPDRRGDPGGPGVERDRSRSCSGPHGLATRPRATRRLAWLADIALAIDRRGGFPGGCRKGPLDRLHPDRIQPPRPDRMPGTAWAARWRNARPRRSGSDGGSTTMRDLAQFEQRARHLDELRRRSGDRRTSRIPRQGSIAGQDPLEEPA